MVPRSRPERFKIQVQVQTERGNRARMIEYNRGNFFESQAGEIFLFEFESMNIFTLIAIGTFCDPKFESNHSTYTL